MLARTALEDAAAFWETGRLAYNGVLAAIVFAYASAFDAWMEIGQRFEVVIVFGAVANALYCAAYPLDLLFQAGPWRDVWRRWRWSVWLGGLLVAAPLAIVGMIVVASPGSDRF